MFDHRTDLPRLDELVIFEDDELICGGSDPATCTVCHTAQGIHRALEVALADCSEDRPSARWPVVVRGR